MYVFKCFTFLPFSESGVDENEFTFSITNFYDDDDINGNLDIKPSEGDSNEKCMTQLKDR